MNEIFITNRERFNGLSTLLSWLYADPRTVQVAIQTDSDSVHATQYLEDGHSCFFAVLSDGKPIRTGTGLWGIVKAADVAALQGKEGKS